MTPDNQLASTGYCLANPEREFLVYLPEGDRVDVDLSRASGRLTVEWMHPEDGTITWAERSKAANVSHSPCHLSERQCST